MVCGLCHREESDHSLSTSGPLRCKYPTHRDNCPGGFRTKCDEHFAVISEIGKKSSAETDFIDDKEDKLANAMAGLELGLNKHEGDQINLLDLHPDQVQKLAQLGLHLGQQSLLKTTVNSNPPPVATASGIFSTPSAATSTPMTQHNPPPTPSTAASSLPWSQNLQQNNTTPTSSLPSLPLSSVTPGPLHGIEELVRQHIANNQLNLQQSQQRQESAYIGPTLPEIRQDPATQQQVASIMDAIKTVSPVFGQLSANPPVAPTSEGSSLLLQLQRLIDQQTPQPQASVPPHQLQNIFGQQPPHSQHVLGQQAVRPHGGVPLQAQTLSQLLLGQQPVQENLFQSNLLNGQVGALSGLYPQHALGLSQQGQLLQQQQAANNVGQDQLSQILSALGYQRPPPPPPPPTNQLSPLILQQILQNPALLQQLLQNPGLLQTFGGHVGQAPAGNPHHGLLQMPQEKPSQQPKPKPLIQHLNQGMSHGRAVHVRPTEFSRYCQVDYSEKVKTDNANLVMFMFGYINQILASRQGIIAPMSEPELVGRLQHLLHLLELTAMFSTNLDFCPFSWQRARNYNARIFSDLDLGALSWASIPSKLDPTSMMQSIEAVPKPEPAKKKFEENPKKKAEDAPCPKWNTCEVNGKCQFEADNPSKKCSKPHICSYCYSKFGFTRTNHKESACNKKKEEGDPKQPTL